MSIQNRSAIISEAANQVINVRDFCGSKSREKEVALETLADNGITPDSNALNEVMAEVDNIWRQSQKEAGVSSKYWV